MLDSLLQEVSEISCGGLILSDNKSGDLVVPVVDIVWVPQLLLAREEKGDLEEVEEYFCLVGWLGLEDLVISTLTVIVILEEMSDDV